MTLTGWTWHHIAVALTSLRMEPMRIKIIQTAYWASHWPMGGYHTITEVRWLHRILRIYLPVKSFGGYDITSFVPVMTSHKALNDKNSKCLMSHLVSTSGSTSCLKQWRSHNFLQQAGWICGTHSQSIHWAENYRSNFLQSCCAVTANQHKRMMFDTSETVKW